MILVKAGSVVMGSERSDLAAASDEFPRHTAVIEKDFLMARFPVSLGAYARFVKATGHQGASTCRGGDDKGWRTARAFSWRHPGFAQTDRHPVVCVSWRDARAYIAWLNAVSGGRYRLPSEREWAYAARAGSSAANFWGDDARKACAYANVNDMTAKNISVKLAEPCRDGFIYTSPVGRFLPNGFGLYDMQGNVWEWVRDCWHGSYNAPPKTFGCAERVARGGSWYDTPGPHRLESREHRGADDALSFFGFRLAADAF